MEDQIHQSQLNYESLTYAKTNGLYNDKIDYLKFNK